MQYLSVSVRGFGIYVMAASAGGRLQSSELTYKNWINLAKIKNGFEKATRGNVHYRGYLDADVYIGVCMMAGM